MSAYIVFIRTKTLDQKELEIYWAGIRDTMKSHPIEVLVAYGKCESFGGQSYGRDRDCQISRREISEGLV